MQTCQIIANLWRILCAKFNGKKIWRFVICFFCLMAIYFSGYFALWLKKLWRLVIWLNRNLAFSHMAKLKSGFFATWLKSCLAKKMAISPLALNHLAENQESPISISIESQGIQEDWFNASNLMQINTFWLFTMIFLFLFKKCVEIQRRTICTVFC